MAQSSNAVQHLREAYIACASVRRNEIATSLEKAFAECQTQEDITALATTFFVAPGSPPSEQSILKTRAMVDRTKAIFQNAIDPGGEAPVCAMAAKRSQND
jgi:hypothetical protein